VARAFLSGYALTSLPLLRTGFALGAVIPIALASATLSIAVMGAAAPSSSPISTRTARA
jgi:hypothetical protein